MVHRQEAMSDYPDHAAAINAAANLLREHADELHNAHTIPGSPFDWCGDNEAKAAYQRELDVATAADTAATAYDALQGERDALLLALTSLVDEAQPLGIERETYQHAVKLITAIEDKEGA